MRLKSAVIEGFRGFVNRAELDLAADVIILHGPNGVGKTSLLDAVLWTLTGRLDRFGGTGGPVSLYAREGIARVEISLDDGGSELVVTRATDGERESIRVREGENELDGAVAESRLSELLLPHLRERNEAPATLSNVITRGVYLQQDLVRQFIEADTAADRFRLVSEIIGAGLVLELQTALEKSRNQWARSTSALRKDKLEPLVSQMAFLDEQLRRLESDVSDSTIEARAASEQLFDRAVDLMGRSHLSIVEPPMTPSGLDRMLKEVAAERASIERDLSTTMNLLNDTGAFTTSPVSDEAQVATLERREEDLSVELANLDAAVASGLQAIAQQRQLQLEDQNRLNRAAALARLALEDLGDKCPVCEQDHDLQATRRHLQSLIAAASSPERDARQPSEAHVESLNSNREQIRRDREEVRGKLRDMRAANQEAAVRRSIYSARLADMGITGQAEAKPALEARVDRLRQKLADINELLRSGEELTLGIVHLSEQRRRVDLVRQRDELSGKITEATRQVERQETTHKRAGRIIDGLRGASVQVTKKQVDRVAPLFQRIYSRIDPHPTFRVTRILTGMEQGKGVVRVGISDPDQGDKTHDAIPVLSSSQLNSFAVSLFLALNLALPSLKLKLTMLDDPLQSLDSINLLGLVDVLRRFRQHRQIFLSTHESRLIGLLQRKLRPVRHGERMMTIIFDGWTRSGPDFRMVPVTFDGGKTEVLVA
jgi:DNA repair exonuclease SbcCD ATPase subunit